MHPVLFEIHIPEFLQGILPSTISIYSYGFFISFGAVCGFLYTAYQAKRQYHVSVEKTQTLVILIIIASVVGGKFFIIFENPGLYLSRPTELFDNFSSGFVFYGSLLFAIPTMLIFFKKNNLPAFGMLDIMAGTTCIVHGFGRIGCFMAGCCYGTPNDGPFSVTFTDPQCSAEPLNTPLHPIQLYSSLIIFSILVTVIFVSRRKQFDGQVFMIYLMLYAVARSILEIFRGDLSRGFLIDGVLSNSQFISLLIFTGAMIVYIFLQKKTKKAP